VYDLFIDHRKIIKDGFIFLLSYLPRMCYLLETVDSYKIMKL